MSELALFISGAAFGTCLGFLFPHVYWKVRPFYVEWRRKRRLHQRVREEQIQNSGKPGAR